MQLNYLKTAFLILIVLSVSLAQCDIYVGRAKAFLENASSTDMYAASYAAAQEYEHAANCFEREGKSTSANVYYGLAALNYVSAAKSLQPGGDLTLKVNALKLGARNYLKIEAYQLASDYYNQAISLLDDNEGAVLAEEAGDLFAESGIRTDASNFYEIAHGKFAELGMTKDAERVSAKLESLYSGEEPRGNITVVLFWFMLFIILLIILVSTVISVARGKKAVEAKVERKPAITKQKQESEHVVKHIEKKHSERKKGARERAIEKLRKKYVPK